MNKKLRTRRGALALHKKTTIVFAALGFVLIATGAFASVILMRSSQDLRNQASVEVYSCRNSDDCSTGEFCDYSSGSGKCKVNSTVPTATPSVGVGASCNWGNVTASHGQYMCESLTECVRCWDGVKQGGQDRNSPGCGNCRPDTFDSDCGWANHNEYACASMTECVQCVDGRRVGASRADCYGKGQCGVQPTPSPRPTTTPRPTVVLSPTSAIIPTSTPIPGVGGSNGYRCVYGSRCASNETVVGNSRCGSSCSSGAAICCKPIDLSSCECTAGDATCTNDIVFTCNNDCKSWTQTACTGGRVCGTGGSASCVYPDKKDSGDLCQNDSDCESNSCIWSLRRKVCENTSATKIKAGATCGTNANNGSCVDGYACSQNKCVKERGDIIDDTTLWEVSDGSSCDTDINCTSGNCQSVPGGKVCLPAGQSITSIKITEGERCGTNSFDRTCVDGLRCVDNRCVNTQLATMTVKDNGRLCSSSAECKSGFCNASSKCADERSTESLNSMGCEGPQDCGTGACNLTTHKCVAYSEAKECLESFGCSDMYDADESVEERELAREEQQKIAAIAVEKAAVAETESKPVNYELTNREDVIAQEQQDAYEEAVKDYYDSAHATYDPLLAVYTSGSDNMELLIRECSYLPGNTKEDCANEDVMLTSLFPYLFEEEDEENSTTVADVQDMRQEGIRNSIIADVSSSSNFWGGIGGDSFFGDQITDGGRNLSDLNLSIGEAALIKYTQAINGLAGAESTNEYINTQMELNELYGVTNFTDIAIAAATYGLVQTDRFDARISDYEHVSSAVEVGGRASGKIAMYSAVVALPGLGGLAAAGGAGAAGIAATSIGAGSVAMSQSNMWYSASQTASICETVEDYSNNPDCKRAALNTGLSVAGAVIAPIGGSLSAGSKGVTSGIAGNAINNSSTVASAVRLAGVGLSGGGGVVSTSMAIDVCNDPEASEEDCDWAKTNAAGQLANFGASTFGAITSMNSARNAANIAASNASNGVATSNAVVSNSNFVSGGNFLGDGAANALGSWSDVGSAMNTCMMTGGFDLSKEECQTAVAQVALGFAQAGLEMSTDFGDFKGTTPPKIADGGSDSVRDSTTGNIAVLGGEGILRIPAGDSSPINGDGPIIRGTREGGYNVGGGDDGAVRDGGNDPTIKQITTDDGNISGRVVRDAEQVQSVREAVAVAGEDFANIKKVSADADVEIADLERQRAVIDDQYSDGGQKTMTDNLKTQDITQKIIDAQDKVEQARQEVYKPVLSEEIRNQIASVVAQKPAGNVVENAAATVAKNVAGIAEAIKTAVSGNAGDVGDAGDTATPKISSLADVENEIYNVVKNGASDEQTKIIEDIQRTQEEVRIASNNKDGGAREKAASDFVDNVTALKQDIFKDATTPEQMDNAYKRYNEVLVAIKQTDLVNVIAKTQGDLGAVRKVEAEVVDLEQKANDLIAEIDANKIVSGQDSPEKIVAWEKLELEAKIARNNLEQLGKNSTEIEQKLIALSEIDEIIIPIISTDPLIQRQIESIIRDTEIFLAKAEGIDYVSSRENQIETFQKLLSGDRVGAQLGTAAGKTFLGAGIAKIQVEVLGSDSANYLARNGQETSIRDSFDKMTLADQDVMLLDSKSLGDPAYVKDFLDAEYTVYTDNELKFVGNHAVNPEDPNFKAAVAIYNKITSRGTAISENYIDELHLTLKTGNMAINPLGESSIPITKDNIEAVKSVGNAITKAKLVDQWGFGKQLSLETEGPNDAKVSVFKDDDLVKIFDQLKKDNPNIPPEVYDAMMSAVSIEKAFNASGGGIDAAEKIIQDIAQSDRPIEVSAEQLRIVLDQVDAISGYAQVLARTYDSDYVRAVDTVLLENKYSDILQVARDLNIDLPNDARSVAEFKNDLLAKINDVDDSYKEVVNNFVKDATAGREFEPVTIPASAGVASEGQTYNKNDVAIYEYVGAKVAEQLKIPGAKPNFDGLTASSDDSITMGIVGILRDIYDGDGSIHAVTGTMGDMESVLDTVFNFKVYSSNDSADKIWTIGGGRVQAENSFVARDIDAAANRVIDMQATGRFDKGRGMDADGNLKLAVNEGIPELYAKKFAESGEFDDRTFAVQVNGKNYEIIKFNSDGSIESRQKTVNGKPGGDPITDKYIQDLYTGGAKKLVTIIGKGGGVGDSIRTGENVPTMTITNKNSAESEFVQNASRADRSDWTSDQTVIIIDSELPAIRGTKNGEGGGDAELRLADALVKPEEWSDFRQNLVDVQKILQKANVTEALDQVEAEVNISPFRKVIENNMGNKEVQIWARDNMVAFNKKGDSRRLNLTAESQTTLSARQEKMQAHGESWKNLMADPANDKVLDYIRINNPDIHADMVKNAAAADPNKIKLSYAEIGSSSDSVMTAKNLLDFVKSHNNTVIKDIESKYVSGSGKNPDTNVVASRRPGGDLGGSGKSVSGDSGVSGRDASGGNADGGFGRTVGNGSLSKPQSAVGDLVGKVAQVVRGEGGGIRDITEKIQPAVEEVVVDTTRVVVGTAVDVIPGASVASPILDVSRVVSAVARAAVVPVQVAVTNSNLGDDSLEQQGDLEQTDLGQQQQQQQQQEVVDTVTIASVVSPLAQLGQMADAMENILGPKNKQEQPSLALVPYQGGGVNTDIGEMSDIGGDGARIGTLADEIIALRKQQAEEESRIAQLQEVQDLLAGGGEGDVPKALALLDVANYDVAKIVSISEVDEGLEIIESEVAEDGPEDTLLLTDGTDGNETLLLTDGSNDNDGIDDIDRTEQNKAAIAILNEINNLPNVISTPDVKLLGDGISEVSWDIADNDNEQVVQVMTHDDFIKLRDQFNGLKDVYLLNQNGTQLVIVANPDSRSLITSNLNTDGPISQKAYLDMIALLNEEEAKLASISENVDEEIIESEVAEDGPEDTLLLTDGIDENKTLLLTDGSNTNGTDNIDRTEQNIAAINAMSRNVNILNIGRVSEIVAESILLLAPVTTSSTDTIQNARRMLDNYQILQDSRNSIGLLQQQNAVEKAKILADAFANERVNQRITDAISTAPSLEILLSMLDNIGGIFNEAGELNNRAYVESVIDDIRSGDMDSFSPHSITNEYGLRDKIMEFMAEEEVRRMAAIQEAEETERKQVAERRVIEEEERIIAEQKLVDETRRLAEERELKEEALKLAEEESNNAEIERIKLKRTEALARAVVLNEQTATVNDEKIKRDILSLISRIEQDTGRVASDQDKFNYLMGKHPYIYYRTFNSDDGKKLTPIEKFNDMKLRNRAELYYIIETLKLNDLSEEEINEQEELLERQIDIEKSFVTVNSFWLNIGYKYKDFKQYSISDYFKLNGVDITASYPQVKKANRKLLRTYHSDHFTRFNDGKLTSEIHDINTVVNNARDELEEYIKDPVAYEANRNSTNNPNQNNNRNPQDIQRQKDSAYAQWNIQSMRNFYDLISMFDNISGMYDSSGNFISSEDMISLIKEVREGKKDVGYITGAGNLRYKVNELLAAENASRVAIDRANSFDNLYIYLKGMGGLSGTNKHYYYGELRVIMNKVRSGTLSVDAITSTVGLRQKVKSLLAHEQKLEQARLLINKVNTFEELFTSLNRMGDIRDPSSFRVFTPAQLKIAINNVRNNKSGINSITEVAGLRDRVAYLLKEEKEQIRQAEAQNAQEQPVQNILKVSYESLYNHGSLKARNGNMVFGTDKGIDYKEWNEDSVVVDSEDGFSSIDGMGGMGTEKAGQRAASILANQFKDAFGLLRENNTGASYAEYFKNTVRSFQEKAQKRMNSDGLGDGGAVYAFAKVYGDTLYTAHVGDARVLVIGKKGVRFSTRDHSLGNMFRDIGNKKDAEYADIHRKNVVMRSVSGTKNDKIEFNQIKLEPGDKIIASSDFLFDNYTNKELAKMLKGLTAEEAIKLIELETRKKMSPGGGGKKDNRGIIIYDYKPESAKKRISFGDIKDSIRGFASNGNNNPNRVKIMTKKLIIGANRNMNTPNDSIRLKINDPRISGDHLEIEQYEDGTFTIRDMGSTNGTYIGRYELEANTNYLLKNGSVINIGSVKLKVSISNDNILYIHQGKRQIFASAKYMNMAFNQGDLARQARIISDDLKEFGKAGGWRSFVNPVTSKLIPITDFIADIIEEPVATVQNIWESIQDRISSFNNRNSSQDKTTDQIEIENRMYKELSIRTNEWLSDIGTYDRTTVYQPEGLISGWVSDGGDEITMDDYLLHRLSIIGLPAGTTEVTVDQIRNILEQYDRDIVNQSNMMETIEKAYNDFNNDSGLERVTYSQDSVFLLPQLRINELYGDDNIHNLAVTFPSGEMIIPIDNDTIKNSRHAYDVIVHEIGHQVRMGFDLDMGDNAELEEGIVQAKARRLAKINDMTSVRTRETYAFEANVAEKLAEKLGQDLFLLDHDQIRNFMQDEYKEMNLDNPYDDFVGDMHAYVKDYNYSMNLILAGGSDAVQLQKDLKEGREAFYNKWGLSYEEELSQDHIFDRIGRFVQETVGRVFGRAGDVNQGGEDEQAEQVEDFPVFNETIIVGLEPNAQEGEYGISFDAYYDKNDPNMISTINDRHAEIKRNESGMWEIRDISTGSSLVGENEYPYEYSISLMNGDSQTKLTESYPLKYEDGKQTFSFGKTGIEIEITEDNEIIIRQEEIKGFELINP